MGILSNSAKLSSLDRRLIILVIIALAFPSSYIQPAEAMELLSDVQVAVQATKTDGDSNVTALVAPTSTIQKSDTVAKIKVEEKTTIKKKWSRAKSPDLVTGHEYSSEPAVRTMVVRTTAYTSNPRECDSTPFVTANGTQVRDGIVAANFLKFGTRIRIPEYFGDKVFEVHDRMNARYNVRVDIWMLNKADARAWGRRNVMIEILNPTNYE